MDLIKEFNKQVNKDGSIENIKNIFKDFDKRTDSMLKTNISKEDEKAFIEFYDFFREYLYKNKKLIKELTKFPSLTLAIGLKYKELELFDYNANHLPNLKNEPYIKMLMDISEYIYMRFSHIKLFFNQLDYNWNINLENYPFSYETKVAIIFGILTQAHRNMQEVLIYNERTNEVTGLMFSEDMMGSMSEQYLKTKFNNTDIKYVELDLSKILNEMKNVGTA